MLDLITIGGIAAGAILTHFGTFLVGQKWGGITAKLSLFEKGLVKDASTVESAVKKVEAAGKATVEVAWDDIIALVQKEGKKIKAQMALDAANALPPGPVNLPTPVAAPAPVASGTPAS